MTTEPPPAGWYPNPDGSGGLRWWSGVGWTGYTRPGGPPQAPAAADVAPAAVTEALEQQPAPPPVAPEADQQSPAPPPNPWEQTQQFAPAATAPQEPSNPWAQQAPQWQQPAGPVGGYATYQPLPKAPLTGSGMRPLAGMFSDIGRIVRRAWLPILGISIAIWAVVSLVYITVLLTTVDLSALQRAFDLVGVNAEQNPESGLPTTDSEIAAAFRDAFSALSPAGWALLLAAMTVLLLVATAIQTAAVNRLAMDAAAGQQVRWGAGWRSGFTAGWRLFGYYLLLGVVVGVIWTVATIAVIALGALNVGLGVAAGILAFVGLIALSVWLTGRLIPVTAQVVVGRRAISWSWQHTKGKFWAVLGRYILWSLAASVIVNIIVTVFSIPVSLVFLGTASSTSTTAELGASLVLSLVTLPLTMALSAVTFLGIVPIWRDLTDHPEYRSIDENGLPITAR